jgi:hypothetical protein
MINNVNRSLVLSLASAAVLALSALPVGCAAPVEAEDTAAAADAEDEPIGQIESAIIGDQRSASAYSEAVMVKVHNQYNDFCSGVLIAPKVVLTAAHCIVFNPGGTWTIVAPFARGGAQTRTASFGEPMEAAFAELSYWDYNSFSSGLHDVGLIYLDAPMTGVRFPAMSARQFGGGHRPLSVSAVGRAFVDSSAGLVLSEKAVLSRTTAEDGYVNTYKTRRLTDGGDSGGPLFIEGTHRLVGTEALFTWVDPQIDFWARLDGVVFRWMAGRVRAHGGWGPPWLRHRH